MRIALICAFALALTACATHERPPVPAPPTDIAPSPLGLTAEWDGRPGTAGWTEATRAALTGPGAVLLEASPSDATAFCPEYASLSTHGRLQFWVTLISAMAKRESAFDPTDRYDEPGLDEDSIGLMQLSLGDAHRYGCAFASEADIADPSKNLDCAVRIMARLIPRAGVIGGGGNISGAAAYWSTLRDRPQNIASRTYIISKTSVSTGCAA